MGKSFVRNKVARTKLVYLAMDTVEKLAELHKATDKLLLQNALLEAENESSQDGRLVVSPEGRTISFNKKYLELWGISSNQLLDKSESERLQLLKGKVAKPKSFISHIRSINASVYAVVEDEIELIDGRWFQRYTTPLGGPHKEHYGRIWFVRDITEHKMEMRRQEIFLGIIGHELRTPLASIKAYLHLIGRAVKKETLGVIPEYVEKLDNQANKLNKLIKDLLDISTIRADRLDLNKEVFDFDQFILEVVNDMRPTTKHVIAIEGATKKYIEADRLRLNEVFTNLLRNAIKYSPDTLQIRVHLTGERQSVQVSVIDHGVGIPKKKQDKIFDLFFRVSNSSGIAGFGVGLYIASEIIKRHKGSITVKSELHKGSTFTVRLPIHLS